MKRYVKRYVKRLFGGIGIILAGIFCIDTGFIPIKPDIPIVFVFVGIIGIAGIGMVLFGLYYLMITCRDIFRHFKRKKKKNT